MGINFNHSPIRGYKLNLKIFNLKPPLFAEEQLDFLKRQVMADAFSGKKDIATMVTQKMADKILLEMIVNKL